MKIRTVLDFALETPAGEILRWPAGTPVVLHGDGKAPAGVRVLLPAEGRPNGLLAVLPAEVLEPIPPTCFACDGRGSSAGAFCRFCEGTGYADPSRAPRCRFVAL